MRVRLLPTVAAVLACLLVAAGCAGGGEPPARLPLDDGDAPTAEALESPAPDVAAAPAPTPLVMVVGDDADLSFDPLAVDLKSPFDLQVLDLLYEGLTRWDAPAGDWTLGLASAVDTSDDGLVWTFDLSSGAVFSDGRPLVAADVERSIEAVIDREAWLPGLRLDHVSDVVAVGRDRVELRLERPDPLLPAALSHPVFGVVPDGELDGRTGSGSHVYDPESETFLWSETFVSTGATLPDVHLVRVSPTAKVGGLDADIVFAEEWIGPPPTDTVPAPSTGLTEVHYGFNLTSWKLADPDRRALIVGAVDQAAFSHVVPGAVAIDVLDGGPGCGDECGPSLQPTTSTLPELFVDYVLVSDGNDWAALAEAAIAEELAAQLRRSGIPAQARAHSLAEFVELVRAGEHEIYRTGWAGLTPDVDSRLAPFVADGADNISGLADAWFDAAIDSARTGDTGYEAAWAALDTHVVAIPVLRYARAVRVRPDMVAVGAVRPDGTVDLGALPG